MGADGAAGGSSPADPVELLRSRRYVAILVMGAVVGVPVAVVAYFFLKVVGELQHYVFTTLPGDLGFDAEPAWWPIPMVALGTVIYRHFLEHSGSKGVFAGWLEPKEVIIEDVQK